MPSSPLTPEEKKVWLSQHLRSRVYACFASPGYVQKLISELPAGAEQAHRCELELIRQASWEGRHAALRWLIEFIGVKADKNGKPDLPEYRLDDDINITFLDSGRLLDLSSPEAHTLACMWQAFTKVTAHATHKAKFGDITEDSLRNAAKIILRHLRATVYAHIAKPLSVPDETKRIFVSPEMHSNSVSVSDTVFTNLENLP